MFRVGRHGRHGSHEMEFVSRCLRVVSDDLLLDIARGYMLKADNITKSWTRLRRNLDGQADEMPLPDKLAGRKAEYEDAANRLRDLIKADPIAMDLSPYECERLERFLRDPQKERLLEYDPDDPFYRNMFNRGLIDREGLTELGRKAMEHYISVRQPRIRVGLSS